MVRRDRPAFSASFSADHPSMALAPDLGGHWQANQFLFFWHYRYKLNMSYIAGNEWRSEFQRLEGAYAPSTMRAYYADVEAFES